MAGMAIVIGGFTAIGLLVRPVSSLAALGLAGIAFGAIVNTTSASCSWRCSAPFARRP